MGIELKKVVVLNDTRADFHHGCSRVMSVLEQGLQEAGLTVTARSPLRHRWWEDRKFLAHLAQADRVVINGEGTLHHGRVAGQNLLKVVDHDLCRAPVYLVNALYQSNPPEWVPFLEKFSGIWTRDQRSEAELCESGIPCNGTVPDLTLCNGFLPHAPTGRTGLVVGDSVDDSVSEELRRFAAQQGAALIPSLSHLKRPKGRTLIGRAIRNRHIQRIERQAKRAFPNLVLCKSTPEYAQHLANAQLHITGRFHGVCFSLLT